MAVEILREHWEKTKVDNENQILSNMITKQMAEEVVKLCDRKIAEFPVIEPKKEEIKKKS